MPADVPPNASSVNLSDYDETQVALMEEKCIKIDKNDNILGATAKKECHLRSNIETTDILHRAFSVFLFDEEGKLLIQQRSEEKITFPLYWANTCCSHPLYFENEMDPEDHRGVKRAAVRKLEHELGIAPSELDLSKFTFLTRIHYQAPCDDKWAEHEIDYILFIQTPVTLNLNKNEVCNIKYVTQAEVKEMLATSSDKKSGLLVSPWFRMIAENLLMQWWDAVLEGKDVKTLQDVDTIHRF